MRFRILALLGILSASSVASTQAEFLVGQDWTGKNFQAIKYTYVGTNAVYNSTSALMSYSSNTQGVVAAGADQLYTSGSNSGSSIVESWTLSLSGGSIAYTKNTGFGTSGTKILSSGPRGLNVSADGSKVSVALLAAGQAINLDSSTGANSTPTLNTGQPNVYRAAQTSNGNYYVVGQAAPGHSTAYTVWKFDSAGSPSPGSQITLAGMPSAANLRDILFLSDNSFYVTNYASVASGGGIYKYTLSGTSATLDTSFGVGGKVSMANAFGLTRDNKGTLFVSAYFSTASNSLINQVSSTGTMTSFQSFATNGFQYISFTQVPEPSTYALAILSAAMLGYVGRRKKNTKPEVNG